ncbi:hypothetical protein PKOR_23210 [Pontibacter korlensis]|uniref:Lipoprotein n=1 Tax=Pontibacter korlensis TaxID=400092 RepID=A0A0E3ZJ49_9BACT|nr:hypothetical protein [Pontibacter korlensis]AKD05410.1 hypothetical protein PKOR_23210 [Pontibacter korlensis]
MSIRILSLVILVLTALACKKPTPGQLLYAKEGDVKIEIDSVGVPELAAFPIRFKLTNYTNKKVVLVFDTISNEYKDQVRNLYITADQDTFFLGIRNSEEYVIFNPRTSTSFLGYGYFIYGKGHFDSFGEIDSVFKKGKLKYTFGKMKVQNNALKEVIRGADTLLIPPTLEAKTDKAKIVDRFLSGSFWWQEKKL